MRFRAVWLTIDRDQEPVLDKMLTDADAPLIRRLSLPACGVA